MWGTGTVREGGKQREREIRSRRQTDGQAPGQHCSDTGVPGTPSSECGLLGTGYTQGCWHPPHPTPRPQHGWHRRHRQDRRPLKETHGQQTHVPLPRTQTSLAGAP